MDYFKARNIPLQVPIELGVKAVKKGGKDVIAYPYRRDGLVVNYKYRYAGFKGFAQLTGGDPCFFNESVIGTEGYVIIVEGEEDCLSWIAAGFKSVVSLPAGGINPKDKNFRLKFEFMDDVSFDDVDKIYIATDNDPVGDATAKELARRIGIDKCYRVIHPLEKKDANDVLKSFPQDKKLAYPLLSQSIDEAKMWEIPDIVSTEDLRERVKQMDNAKTFFWDIPYNNTFIPEAKYPNQNSLFENFKVVPSNLCIVTGWSGDGKSTFVDNLCVKLSASYGIKHAIFSPEHTTELHAYRLAEIVSGKPLNPMRGTEVVAPYREYRDLAMEWVYEHFFWVHPQKPPYDNNLLNERIESLVKRKGISNVVRDPENEIYYPKPKGLDIDSFLWTSLRLSEKKHFLRKNGIHEFLLVHPTTKRNARYSKTLKRTVMPLVTGQDMSGGNTYKTKTDSLISVYPDRANLYTRVFIEKIKFSGITGHSHSNSLFKYNAKCERLLDNPSDIGPWVNFGEIQNSLTV